jgi:dTDP-4-dehydrorhamnose 3,5-epimerase
MKITSTPIAGVNVIEQSYGGDNRGFFGRLFCAQELADIIGERQIVQINHSGNRKAGCVRGLHYQLPPYAEMKLIRCIKGKVWDVAVDLRTHSATYLQWFAQELSADNHKMMVIPEGCAHGFQVLDNDSELVYFHTASYHPESEGGVNLQDESLNIPWPLALQEQSERDKALPHIDSDFEGIIV